MEATAAVMEAAGRAPLGRRPARQLAWRLCGGASIAAALVITAVGALTPGAFERELWMVRAAGYAALAALFLSLSMTPLLRFARRLTPAWASAALYGELRRSAGICAALWASLHATIGALTYLRGTEGIATLWAHLSGWAYLRAGLAALVVLLLLLATSFPRLVAKLGLKLWKPLHRLAYPAAGFVFLHLLLSPFAPRRQTLALFAGLLAVGALRLLRPSPR